MIKIELPKIALKEDERIPRIIHYCWFGGKPLPKDVKKYIKTWKKYLPDYKIICWNEDSFDVFAHPYTKEAYESKKWAFITDYVRLYVLYHFGGIYMDSDVEVTKNLNVFLKHAAFSSFESPHLIPTGLMASERNSFWIKTLLEYYENKHFVDEFGKPELIANTIIITDISKAQFGLEINNKYQVLSSDVHIYPNDFFCPMDWALQKIVTTDNTYAIHHFAGSWIEGKEKNKYIKHRKRAGVLLGKIIGGKLYRVIAENTWRKYLDLK